MSTLSSRRYRVNTTSTLNKRFTTVSIAPHNVLRLINRNKFRRNNKLSQLLSTSNWDIHTKSNDYCGTIDRYKPLRWKVFVVNAKLADGSFRQLIGESGQTVLELVMPVIKDLSLKMPTIRLLDSDILVDNLESAALLEGEHISVSEGFIQSNTTKETDSRFSIVERLLITEREFSRTIKAVKDLYEKPLRKLLCIGNEELRLLFDWTEPMCSMSCLMQLKLQKALTSWDNQTCVGAIFSKQFWHQFEEYLSSFPSTLNLLKDKQENEDEFVVICRLRKGAAKHSLFDLLYTPLDRIAQYDKYLSQLVTKTSTDHPDYPNICRSANKAKTMVKRSDTRQEESDLDRIQELFPSDNLRLHETDPLSPRKGLLRSKSLAASRLHRALSGKSHKIEVHNSHSNDIDGSNRRRLDSNSDSCVHRYFIMDGPVVFTIGVQSQERHLFLFNDLMLIAKSRSSGNYKLKEKVRVSEMWISKTSLEDVCEATKSPLTSFVIGWPTNNVVATFSNPQSKELWHERIQLSINKVKEKEGKSNTTIQISYWDQIANEEKYTLVKVTNRDTTVDAIKSALQEFKCEGDLTDYQLWVKTSRDDTPYPLIGHEYPFAIKMNFVRDLLHRSNLDLQNFNNIAADNKCIFILRKSFPKNSSLLENSKKAKKPRKPINWPFKKISVKADISVDSGISSVDCTPTKGKLFGQHLDLLCNEERLPKPIQNMLKELFQKGPFTVGIFRKSANARVCKEFRAKLETDPNSDMNEVPVIVIASVFKEFLRSLPDCLLQSSLYPKWIEAIAIENNCECRERMAHLLQSLPASYLLVLRHFLCALWYISHQSSFNKMCSVNLGVCVGQSLLSPNAFGSPNPIPPTSQRCEEMSKQVPKLIAYLIDHCPELLGEDTLHLLGSPPEKDVSRQDSGAEESDSLNSLPDNGVGSNTSSNGNRCDDSSIDSLERALLDDSQASSGNDQSSATFGNKMSLSNLSRDSGLTLSDTQLYNPEDEESESDNFAAYRKLSPLVYPYLAKSVPHLDTTGLESDINHTFSYGRSVGVSIDGSCHDVVRKRRHQGLISHDYPHYINRHYPKNVTFGHNHNRNAHYRQTVLPNCSESPEVVSHHNHIYHCNHNPIQHIPIHYSKSYSYGINGDDLNENESPDSANGNANHREYRYRRPPLAAVLGGAPVSSSTTFHDSISGAILRRSSSEESLVRKYANEDNDLSSYSMQNAMTLPYPQAVLQQSWGQTVQQNDSNTANKCCGFTPVQYSNGINGSSTQVTLRADVHHYDHYTKQNANDLHQHNGHNHSQYEASTTSLNSCRLVRNESNSCKTQQQIINERVGSICSSSSETASQRSSISKQSNLSKQSSSSLRSNSMGISCPPSYEEAMNRKERLCRAQNNISQNQLMLRKTSSASTSSANSNQIYEESVRIYHEDLHYKNNVTHRAVPVRVKSNDSDNSDVENNEQLRKNSSTLSLHKQVQRAASEGTPLINGARIVRISAQNHNHVHYHHSHQQPVSVSVLQRSAKDFTPEEWKKDINCNVANLRKLFTTKSAQPSNCDNTYNIYVRQSGRPISMLIENNNNNNNNSSSNNTNATVKQRPPSIPSIQETSSLYNQNYKSMTCLENEGRTTDLINCQTSGKGVTVVHVGQNDIHGKPSIIAVHKRSDSVGNSSEEESYV